MADDTTPAPGPDDPAPGLDDAASGPDDAAAPGHAKATPYARPPATVRCGRGGQPGPAHRRPGDAGPG